MFHIALCSGCSTVVQKKKTGCPCPWQCPIVDCGRRRFLSKLLLRPPSAHVLPTSSGKLRPGSLPHHPSLLRPLNPQLKTNPMHFCQIQIWNWEHSDRYINKDTTKARVTALPSKPFWGILNLLFSVIFSKGQVKRSTSPHLTCSKNSLTPRWGQHPVVRFNPTCNDSVLLRNPRSTFDAFSVIKLQRHLWRCDI